MIPLDTVRYEILSENSGAKVLSEVELGQLTSMEEKEKRALLEEPLTKPIRRFTIINEVYFRSKWAELLTARYQASPITVLEAASGDADMIPQTLSRSNPGSQYITANMNQSLNQSMRNKTKGLSVEFRLIDDDASQILRYVKPDSVDVAAFQHGVNDVLQAILCGKYGIDTVHANWMDCLPKMIELLNKELAEGTFEDSVKDPFLNLVKNLLQTLRDGGIVAIHHYMFQLDLDWGYPPELFHNLIPMVRGWCTGLEQCREIRLEGFSDHWWLFLEKDRSIGG